MNEDALLWLEATLGHSVSFDEGVEAARNACAAGASIAAAAITAAAYYDNPVTGLGALCDLMSRLRDVPNELTAWRRALSRRHRPETGDDEFTPGFGFVSAARAEHVLLTCRRFVELRGARGASRCASLVECHRDLSGLAGPLNETGLAALAYLDAGIDSESAERRWLSCKVAVAISEAQKARRAGLAAFPFSFGHYVYDGPQPAPVSLDLPELKRQLGLDDVDD